MKRQSKIIIWGIVGLIVILLIAYPKIKDLRERNKSKQVTAGQDPASVQVTVVQPGLLNEIINASGSLMADEEVNLTFETTGKITAIYFKEGTRVKKGQLLAKLKDDDLQAQLGKLVFQEQLAQEKESRQKILLDKEAVSQESYDQVKTDLQGTEAEINILKAHIAETEIHAPFDGVVGLRYVSEGAYVDPTVQIAKLVKNQPLKIDFSIPERYAGMVQPGAELTFNVEGIDKNFTAHVYAVEPKIDPKTRTIAVRALYNNQRDELQAGRFVSIQLVIRQTKNALQVPTQSIIPELGGEKVFVVKDGMAQSVEIKTGLRTESMIEITDGLHPGDTVVTSGIMQLRNSMPVAIEKNQD